MLDLQIIKKCLIKCLREDNTVSEYLLREDNELYYTIKPRYINIIITVTETMLVSRSKHASSFDLVSTVREIDGKDLGLKLLNNKVFERNQLIMPIQFTFSQIPYSEIIKFVTAAKCLV